MQKSELIYYLKNLRGILLNYPGACARRDKLLTSYELATTNRRVKILPFRCSSHTRKNTILIACIGAFFYVCTFAEFVYAFAQNAKVDFKFGGITAQILFYYLSVGMVVALFGFITLAFFIFSFRSDKKNYKRQVKEIEEQNDYLGQLRQHRDEIKEELDKADIEANMWKCALEESVKKEILPEKYLDEEIIARLIGYLENQRADNMKEALNLYESERREEIYNAQMMEYQEANLQMQRRAAAERQEILNQQAQLQASVDHAAREASLAGFMSALDVDATNRLRRELDEANGKIRI